MDDHDTITRREASSGSKKKLAWMIKQLKSPYDLSLSEHCCWALPQFWQWIRRFIYLMSRWCRLIRAGASWPQFSISWLGPPSCDHHPWHGGSSRVWVGVCYGTREVWLRRQSTRNCSAITNFVQRVGLLPPRIMDIAESLGDSWTYLSVNDYYQKIEDV